LKTLKICSPQLGLNPDSVLGGEVYDRQILLGLAKKGINVEIVLPKNLPHDQNVKNWKITHLPVAHFPAVLFNIILIPYLFLIYSKRQFKILRLHQPQFIYLSAFIFKLFRPEVKIIANFHKFEETKFPFFSSKINNTFDHIICDSQNVKNIINRVYKVPGSKITVAHNGVPKYLKPTLKDKVLIRKYKIKDKKVLLFMGLFIKRKNPLFLLEVMLELSKNDDNYLLMYWGTGPLKKALEDRLKELGLFNKIAFVNPAFGAQKNKIHNLADIFLHPSVDEGMALAPLEAMACAKPVIMTSGYSSKETVENGKNGFIARANDVKDWSTKISTLSNNKKLSEAMSNSALQKVAHEFNWSNSVQINYEVIKKLAKI